MKSTPVVVAVMILIVGCSESIPPDDSQIQAAIAGQLKDIETMTNQGHPTEKATVLYLEYFSSDPTVLPYGGHLLEGRHAVSDFYSSVFSMGTIISNSYTEPTISVSDGFAVRTYEGTAEFRPFESEDILSYTNVYTDVLVQENDAWRIDWHSWVPAQPN